MHIHIINLGFLTMVSTLGDSSIVNYLSFTRLKYSNNRKDSLLCTPQNFLGV